MKFNYQFNAEIDVSEDKHFTGNDRESQYLKDFQGYMDDMAYEYFTIVVNSNVGEENNNE